MGLTVIWDNGNETITSSSTVNTNLWSSGGANCDPGIGTTDQGGIIGVLTDSFTIDAQGPRTVSIRAYKTAGPDSNMKTYYMKLYIFTAE
jgi:hypothetical protein